MIRWIDGNGNELRLDQRPFILRAHDGFGAVPTPRVEDTAPLQHGVSDKGFKMPPRDIVLYVELFATSWENYYQLRDQLLRYFAPSDRPGFLLVEEGGYSRFIYGFPVSGLGFEDSNREFQRQTVPIVIHCPDPLWVSNVYSSITVQGGGSLDVGEVPSAVPFTVGTSVMSVVETLTYEGSFESHPETITIHGPITDPKITSNSTGGSIDFDGATLGANDIYTIELGHGKNKITDQNGANRIDKLSVTSDLTGFKLIPQGPNTVTVTGSSISGATYVLFIWRDKYIGI